MRDAALDVAGKTGTAQTGYVNTGGDEPKKAWYLARDHAWFAAYSPAKAPEIAVVVLVEHGGSGPTVAAPIAMQIVKEYQRLAASRQKPTVKGAAAKDAKAPADAPAARPAGSGARAPGMAPDGLPFVDDPLAMPPQGRPEDPPPPGPSAP